MELQWSVKKFEDLSNLELYKILQLRINVFVVEQNCPYPECDDKDLQAQHVFATKENEVVAYARLLDKGISYSDHLSIGRVLTKKSERLNQYGIDLMEKSIKALTQAYGEQPIKISAQKYLVSFYNKFGFIQIGEPYLEDGIPHVAMVKS